MAVEYDVVIIGSTLAGIQAAIQAAVWKARVALVDQGVTPVERWSTWSVRHFAQLRQILQALAGSEYLGLDLPAASDTPIDWSQFWQWSDRVIDHLQSQVAAPLLAAQGIDLIQASGQFTHHPQPGFQVGDRLLRARAYLLTPRCQPYLPDIPGLAQTPHLTSTTSMHPGSGSPIPRNLIVIGSDPIGLVQAQTLARLGTQVTVITRQPHLLPQAEPKAAHLLQAQLEAEGIQILTQTRITQIQPLQQIRVQIGAQAIDTEQILIAAGQQLQLADLNLDQIGVLWQGKSLSVNDRLQTQNPRIYLCGQPIADWTLPHFACYEARVALRNALFWPKSPVNYRGIPIAIGTDPELAWVGLTERQARQRYGPDVMVLQQSYPAAQLTPLHSTSTGFCQIVIRRNREILGAHFVGPQASEVIHPIAIAMRQRLKLDTLAQHPFLAATLSQIFYQTAQAGSRLSRRPSLQDGLRYYFNWRRAIDP